MEPRGTAGVMILLSLAAAGCASAFVDGSAAPSTRPMSPAATTVAPTPVSETVATATPPAAAATAGGSSAPGVRLVAAGRIAKCGDDDGSAATAAIAETIGGPVLTLGDHAYPGGTGRDFDRCYDPTWGRFRSRTWPVPGNHDYRTPGASGYFAYFGDRAGTPGAGWYHVEAGNWKMFVLNSECEQVGGCEPGSVQYEWLAEQLRSTRQTCVLAAWHRPIFGSGFRGGSPAMASIGRLLHQTGADVVLTGHDHHYERLVPVDGEGRVDGVAGTHYFNVGTGGRPLDAYDRGPLDVTAFRDNSASGVLVLTLAAGAFSWEFRAVPDGTVTDSGTADCH